MASRVRPGLWAGGSFSAIGLCDPAFTGLSRLHLGPIWLSRFDLRCLASVCAESGSV